MFALRPLFLVILPLFSTVANSVIAQGDGDFVKAEILTLCDSGVIRDLKFQTKGGVDSFSVYGRGFAPVYRYEGPSHLKFFLAGDVPEGIETPVNLVGEVDLPVGASRVLLLFEKKDDDTFHILAVNNDYADFPPGAIRFVNTTGEALRTRIGEKRFVLPPNESRIFEGKGDQHGNIEIAMYREHEGQIPEKIYQSVWRIDERRRTTVFLKAAATRVREIDVRKFSEPIVPEKEE